MIENRSLPQTFCATSRPSHRYRHLTTPQGVEGDGMRFLFSNDLNGFADNLSFFSKYLIRRNASDFQLTAAGLPVHRTLKLLECLL